LSLEPERIKTMDKKTLFYSTLFVAFILAMLYRNWNGSLGCPPSGERSYEALDMYGLPHEERCEEEEIAVNGTIKIVKRLHVSLDAVVRKKAGPPFFKDLVEGKYSLTWGEANKEDIQKHITWMRGGYRYESTQEALRAASVVGRNHSNFYLIGSNSNLKRAIARIREDDHIRIRGYLADVSHLEGTWTTKPPLRVRTDMCNLVYLVDLRIGDTLYR
jgi:hypothetical protein